jgi:hypothetical protein
VITDADALDATSEDTAATVATPRSLRGACMISLSGMWPTSRAGGNRTKPRTPQKHAANHDLERVGAGLPTVDGTFDASVSDRAVSGSIVCVGGFRWNGQKHKQERLSAHSTPSFPHSET